MQKEEHPAPAATLDTAAPNPSVSPQLRGETMAYAVQNGIYNLAANFFEPYIGYQTQKYYSAHDPKHQLRAGNYSQNLIGEFAGDLIGCGTLMAAEALAPEQLHACTRTVRGWVDPFYTVAAKAFYSGDCNEPDYEKNMEKWKTFQERNLVRSGIMATAGILGNVATQKLVAGNPAPAHIIFQGKLLSTVATMALGLGIRFAFPDQMKKMDKWLSKKVFVPMMEEESPSPATQITSAQPSKALQPATAI